MRRLICVLLMLLLLTGCTSSNPIVGTWEAEITVAVLGMDQEGHEASAVTRFTFRKDGTGSWGTSITDGSHPETVREFLYTLEENHLILTYQEDIASTEFIATLNGDMLTLESNRGSFQLTRTK